MPASLVQHYLDEATLRAPDRVALFDGQRTITYAEFSTLTNQLARALADRGVRQGDRVALCLGRSAHSVVGMLGTLKADAAYVPVDTKAPAGRWRQVLEDCRPAAVICDPASEARLSEALGESATLPRIRIDEVGPLDSGPIDYRNGPADTAYVLYTSGSTGTPKGVMISHLAVRTYIDWAVDHVAIATDDVILGTAPFHFDMSIFDVYCPIKAAARFCIAGEMLAMFPPKLVEFIERQGVTVWKGVSSLLMYMARAGVLAPDRMPTLRYVLFGGETFATRYLMQWMEVFPDKIYCNAFGPTEATGISLYHVVDRAPRSPDERVPAGTPCRDTEVVLLSEDGELVPQGEVGELCISGPCLSTGYLGDPGRTSRVFLPDWTDGQSPPRRLYRTGDLARLTEGDVYEFVGRRDNQVKVMGYRIELGDIEHQMMTVEGVRDAAVILAWDPAADLEELVGFFESDRELETAAVHTALRGKLSPYMVPKRLIRLQQIPRSGRGKVDRQALRTLAEGDHAGS